MNNNNNKSMGNTTARERYHHLYNTTKWRKLRLEQLNKEPLCKFCIAFDDRFAEATIVDHIEQHAGNLDLMYDKNNLQSLCKFHHDSYKQRLERRNVQAIGCDVDGNPLDPGNHYNN
ncbi:HNH endonuclease [Vreelandella sedimenti]|uniref:HNH endonuclease signature motif containing protein n=1 Tax=Vreelandella sedimenti TaxID=2729618 RepID=UPI00257DE380|nr:HNH endonuclease [Halomonas sp. UBA3173]